MNELVEILRQDQPFEMKLRPEASLEGLRAALARRYVHVLFSGTRGGTELGVPLDEAASDLAAAEDEPPTGQIHLEGELVLDSVPVRFVGDLDVERLRGRGRLVPLGTV